MDSVSRRLFTALAASAFAFSSCSLLEPGGPSAAKTVRALSAFHVSDVVERVFVNEGYTPILRSNEGITFERDAGKVDQVLYGDWIDGKLTQRVRVTIAFKGNEKYRLRCVPFVVRNPQDVAFEDQHRRLQVYSFHYAALLREVRRQCEELRKNRSEMEG